MEAEGHGEPIDVRPVARHLRDRLRPGVPRRPGVCDAPVVRRRADHRRQVVALFDRPGVSRVHLARWEPPGIALAWCGLAGGFILSGVGMGLGLKTTRDSGACRKSPAFDEWLMRGRMWGP